MKPALSLRLGQQLTMTPALQQAIHLLQLSSVELKNQIEAILASNPLLEQEEDNVQNFSSETLDTPSFLTKDTLPFPKEKSPASHTPLASTTTQKDFEDFLTQKANKVTLKDHLLWQMELTPFSDCDKVIAKTIIDEITEQGFLETPLEDIITFILKTLDQELIFQEVEAVLHRIQQFDPIGVGARNLSECLSVQLKHFFGEFPYQAEAIALVEQHLPLLAKQDYATLCKKLTVSIDVLQDIIQCIQSLTPHPGDAHLIQQLDFTIPNVFVQKVNGTWGVELNPECMPKLKINPFYAKMIRQTDNDAPHQLLQTQLNEAKWFLKSLETRNSTLLKVANYLVQYQKDFLEKGEEAMKPMVLNDVAKAINMHESTISR
ncbi:MAG TPA: RNA polymerase factor sigma-54, partial [Gammaproteobacteria bacterium]|nr:RNA polymerase factor sigma-54 [Gammaproteobacteria bacterium]